MNIVLLGMAWLAIGAIPTHVEAYRLEHGRSSARVVINWMFGVLAGPVALVVWLVREARRGY